MLAVMPPIRIYPGCDKFATNASNAMRRHAKAMHAAVNFVRAGITEEETDRQKIELIESFNDAQAAWGAYHAHLKKPSFP